MSALSLPLSEAEFAVIDVETTGLEPDWGHRVCEVAVVVWRGGREVDSFWSLVNPHRSIEPSAALINRLTDEMLRDAPPMETILPHLRKMLAGRVLVAYNASFDVGFLRQEYRQVGEELPPFRIIDVMALAKRLLPQLGRYPLVRVVEAFGLSFATSHRAMADVEATSAVFLRFLDQLSAHGITTVEELEAITRPSSPFAESLRRDKIELLRKAIAGGQRVHLIYRARDQALSERDVTPLEIRTYAGRAQLIGYCHLRQAERTFTVDLIQDIHLIDA